MTDWELLRLGDHAETFAGGTPPRSELSFFGGTIPWVKSTEVNLGRIHKTEEFLTEKGLRSSAAKWIPPQTVLVALYGATAAQIAYLEIPATANQAVLAVRPDSRLDSLFLFYALTSAKEQILFRAQGSGQPNLNKQIIEDLRIRTPQMPHQRRIAEILSTLDETIEQTEDLIAKYQQIKAGLMHDLFTRGLSSEASAKGGVTWKLRPTRAQAPHLYQSSPLGWIPKEWTLAEVSAAAESLTDGPFGSNLKTEHYVLEPGVRVVRLQNIQEGAYDDTDRVYVSQNHADYLARHNVIPNDVLVAALGDENYPVGRACCYPVGFPPATNKADCYRLRCKPDLALNTYVMHFFNTPAARRQVKRFEQGVTRRRMNLGNFRRLTVALPKTDEQSRVVARLSAANAQLDTTALWVTKLRQMKHGLMHDLLTGGVPVKVQEPTTLASLA